MPHRTTAAAGLIRAGAALLLTGCSSSSGHTPSVTETGYSSTSPLPATLPASEAPIPDSTFATGAHTAGCWRAIRDQYTPGTMQPTGAPTTPPECAGLSSDGVSAVAEDVLAHQLG